MKLPVLRGAPVPRLFLFVILSNLLSALTGGLMPRVAFARGVDDPERVLSPYFFVESEAASSEQFPLLSTDVDVQISGVIADVSVVQIYKNDGSSPINARYVFPASTRAAVHGLSMKVGQRVVEAKIRERDAARREFEAAKRQGKTASLLEQQRPNVFSMDVSNILPGDQVEVSLSYTELLIPEAGVYEFVYPGVVGPRYAGPAEQQMSFASQNDWVKTPYLPEGSGVRSAFNIAGRISGAVPIAGFATPSHALSSTWDNPNTLVFALKPGAKNAGNRDVVLRYQLRGKTIETGLSLYDRGGQKFFMAMVQPPKRVTPDSVPPREYVFVLDVSGSMHGFPLDTAKRLLEQLVSALRPVDRFNVMFFSGGSTVLSPTSLQATQTNVQRALGLLSHVEGGGGTELLAALKRAMSFTDDSRFSRNFVVITDGYISAERAVFEHIRDHLGQANVYAFGIGSGVNRYLIEGIARAGLGEPFVVTDPQRAGEVARRFQSYVQTPVLTDVAVDFDGFDAYDVHPSSIPDVLAERPVIIHGKWRGPRTGKVRVTGTAGAGRFEHTLDAATVTPSTANAALPYLWARTRVAELSDFSLGEVTTADRAEIVKLGLGFNLLTPYTSFVAVLREVRNAKTPAQQVQQPLPLPQGVSNQAVAMMGADEPPLALLLIVLLLFLGFFELARRLLVATPGPRGVA